MQYLRILSSSFGEEDFQRIALNLLCSLAINSPIMQMAPPFEQTVIAHT